MKLAVNILMLLVLPITLFSQVVNTENLRLDNPEHKFVGDFDATFGLSRNKAGQTIQLGTKGRVELPKSNSRWMLIAGYNLTQFLDVDDEDAIPKQVNNNGFGHLRYNYYLNDKLTWEAFTQAQFDNIQEVAIRTLVGTGPRFTLVKTDSTRLNIGMLYMYEYEETLSDEDLITYNNDHRMSTYLSGSFALSPQVAINHVTYYQPNIQAFDDFRISSETNLNINVSKALTFKTYFQFIYDAQPPITVPNTMFVLKNGLGVVF